MYKCDDCEYLFEEPKRISEADRGHLYTEEVCPKCKGEDFESVELCDRCGEPEVATKIENGFCQKCASDILCQYADFAATLTDAERAFLETSIHDRL